jgi:hypothetical protein
MTDMTATKRKGLKSGTRTEFSIFAKVKPGHAKALTEVLTGGAVQDPKVLKEGLKAIGTLHEARWVMFDDDTRVMFCSSFDGDWDTYIDDFGNTPAKDFFQRAWSNTEGFPGINDPHVKDWFMDHAVEAKSYLTTYDGTVKEILKALDLQEAFQRVLDDPAAEKALTNPALKPLLDQAAT